ncbi:MAG TPA: DUF1015 domain-containing protein [Firmicutes bacterium]|nr:DUF1015 domain-containing protein [Bacillota bacterium]
MAEIKGFRALRFTDRAGDIAALCCPPYDIISEDERRAFLKKNPYNIIRLELPKEGADPYRTAGETLRQWLQEGILERDAQEGIYIYEEEFEIAGEIKRFRGVISLVHLEEFSKGIVLPHEETLSKAKADRFHLMDATGCNFSQIYSLYNDDGSVENLLRQYSACEPEISFTDYAGVVQRLWPVYDPAAIAALRSLFADKKLYIADGHHRYETALNYRNHLREQGIVTEDSHPANDVMMMLVDMENTGLVVLPTHRVVRELPHFSSEDLLEKSRACFDSMPCAGRAEAEQMLEAAYTAGKTAFVLYAGSEFHLMVLRDTNAMEGFLPDASAAYRGLDVSVLHTLILEQILGIDKANMAAQINLTYTRSAQEAVGAVDSKEADCCFLLNPTKVSEIRDVALAGEKMPQKSTYFYPKLITGLVMNQFL